MNKCSSAKQIRVVRECLEQVLSSHHPLSSLLSKKFLQYKFLGSNDRKAIKEDLYSFVRSWNFWKMSCAELSFDDIFYSFYQGISEFLTGNEKYIDLPKGRLTSESLEGRFDTKFWEAMTMQAPWDVRINTSSLSRNQVLHQLLQDGCEVTPTPWSPLGLRFAEHKKPQGLLKKMIDTGALETQDEGSQLIGLLTGAKPGMNVWDVCAGLGGKTLQLGMHMKGEGLLVASDANVSRLRAAQDRLVRSGLHRVQYRTLEKLDARWQFDRILVDAPCSGTGTWRRHPELSINFSLPDAEKQGQENVEILNQAADRLKKGGILIYATCSILREENEDVIENFLAQNKDFAIKDAPHIWRDLLGIPCPLQGPFLNLDPYNTFTDGFFMAALVRNS